MERGRQEAGRPDGPSAKPRGDPIPRRVLVGFARVDASLELIGIGAMFPMLHPD